MKLHEWLLLLLAYVLFLLLGAASFYFLERGQESDQVQRILQLRSDIQDELMDGENSSTVERRSELLARISDECKVDITNTSKPPATVWNEYNSFFFCFTVVTTIGYGHIAPSTMLGRITCILYALIGIPLNGILLKNISDLFSNKVIRAHQRIKERRYQTKLEVFVDTLFYLSPAVLLFFLVPAGIFIMLEEWNFFQAIYYTFITLTTIGFGDLVAGKVNDPEDASGWIWIYKVALVVWIIFGLGYLLMVLDFISKALYSKKILSLEKKVIRGLTKTKEKFQRNISKEVLQLKKILNELALNRRAAARTPAPARGLVRTQSFPTLVEADSTDAPAADALPLRRADSEPQLAEPQLAELQLQDLDERPADEPAPAERAALLSTVDADDLVAAAEAAAAERRRDGEECVPPPAGAMPSVDSALELLMQATVTLEWDVDSTDGSAASDAAGAEEGAAAAAAAEAPRRASVWQRLGQAWQNRPSLLPGVFPRRPAQPEQPAASLGAHRRRTTTTNLADLRRALGRAPPPPSSGAPPSSCCGEAGADRGGRDSAGPPPRPPPASRSGRTARRRTCDAAGGGGQSHLSETGEARRAGGRFGVPRRTFRSP